jgi:hypothetical protein
MFMRRSVRLALVLGGVLAASILLAPAAEAQWRPRSRVRVFVGAHVGYPYYSPYYDPFFYRGLYGYGWGGSFWPGASPQWGRPRLDRDTVLVRPDVSPDDAQVYVDGYFRGSVSDFDGRFRPLVVEPGEHEFVLYLEGYRTARRTVNLQGGTVYRLREKLVRLAEGEASEPPPKPAPRAEPDPQLPEGAEFLPGRPEPLPGRPAPDESPRRIPRPRGDAPREVPREGIDVEARGFGSLAIRVQPAGAEVLIDGERWEGIEGRPLIVQVAGGRHRVEVRLEGYEPFSTDVEVREGESVPLNVSLPRR